MSKSVLFATAAFVLLAAGAAQAALENLCQLAIDGLAGAEDARAHRADGAVHRGSDRAAASA